MSDKELYFQKMEKAICDILQRPEKLVITYDILDDEEDEVELQITLRRKHKVMKRGEIWQWVLGNYYGWTNLKNRHESGLDIVNYEKSASLN